MAEPSVPVPPTRRMSVRDVMVVRGGQAWWSVSRSNMDCVTGGLSRRHSDPLQSGEMGMGNLDTYNECNCH